MVKHMARQKLTAEQREEKRQLKKIAIESGLLAGHSQRYVARETARMYNEMSRAMKGCNVKATPSAIEDYVAVAKHYPEDTNTVYQRHVIANQADSNGRAIPGFARAKEIEFPKSPDYNRE